MKASRKNPPDYPGIALRTIALSCFLTFISATFGRVLILLGKFRQIKLSLIPVIFIVCVEFSHAETIPATITYYWSSIMPGNVGQRYLTIDQACLADVAAGNIIWPGANNVFSYSIQTEPNVAGCYGPSTYYPSNHILGSVARDYTATCPTQGNWTLFWAGWSGPNGTEAAGTCTRPDQCPANSSGTYPDACTCDKDYEPDPTKTSCVPVSTCKVLPLKALPADDACAQALDNLHTTQAQKDAACGTLTPALKAGEKCLADKLKSVNIPDTATPIPLKVTSDIRDLAYQAHLREIWDKMKKLVRLMRNNPAMQTACAARRVEIAAEKGCDSDGACPKGGCYSPSVTQRSHCLKGRPSSSNDAPHTKGNALDVSETLTIDPLQDVLDARNPPQDIQQFLDAKPDCKLKWGGTFTDNFDLIHFQVK